jgi:hypothetical protein
MDHGLAHCTYSKYKINGEKTTELQILLVTYFTHLYRIVKEYDQNTISERIPKSIKLLNKIININPEKEDN